MELNMKDRLFVIKQCVEELHPDYDKYVKRTETRTLMDFDELITHIDEAITCTDTS